MWLTGVDSNGTEGFSVQEIKKVVCAAIVTAMQAMPGLNFVVNLYDVHNIDQIEKRIDEFSNAIFDLKKEIEGNEENMRSALRQAFVIGCEKSSKKRKCYAQIFRYYIANKSKPLPVNADDLMIIYNRVVNELSEPAFEHLILLLTFLENYPEIKEGCKDNDSERYKNIWEKYFSERKNICGGWCVEKNIQELVLQGLITEIRKGVIIGGPAKYEISEFGKNFIKWITDDNTIKIY